MDQPASFATQPVGATVNVSMATVSESPEREPGSMKRDSTTLSDAKLMTIGEAAEEQDPVLEVAQTQNQAAVAGSTLPQPASSAIKVYIRSCQSYCSGLCRSGFCNT